MKKLTIVGIIIGIIMYFGATRAFAMEDNKNDLSNIELVMSSVEYNMMLDLEKTILEKIEYVTKDNNLPKQEISDEFLKELIEQYRK